MDWPEHFPASCPPSDAEPPSGVFYRLIDQDPSSPQDFYSNLKLQKLGVRFKGRDWGGDECVAAAVSVHTDPNDARRTRDMVPAMKHKLLARGEVDGDGVAKNTPSKVAPSHHSWWLPAGCDPHEDFKAV